MRLRLIEDHRDVWPVRVMCEALNVSPSGYYAWRSRPVSPRKIANRALLVDLRRVHAQHQERYGAPRGIAIGVFAVVDELGFQRAEETLHRCIVPAVSLAAHRLGDNGGLQDGAVVAGGVLGGFN